MPRSVHEHRHHIQRLLCFFLFLLCSSLSGSLLADTPISYRHSIQPIFEQKCVACHACNDAPCQLNLGSGEGALRGATKIKVYDGTRTRIQAPTRLFIDAQSTPEWRAKGFSSVLGNNSNSGQGNSGADVSLLARMIELGHANTLAPNSKLPDNIPIGTDVTNQCALNDDEIAKFVRKYPQRGMPLGVTGLSATEYQTLKAWLAQGAAVDSEPRKASAEEEQQIAEWEKLFNQTGARKQLVARWLYEHLFLSHLYFETVKDSQFFEVVRSRTPSGKAIDLIATPQPNDPPGVSRVYYRLRPVQGVIVHKTHITYPLSAEKISRIKTLFFSSNWDAGTPARYDEEARANPFATFAAIPPRARYQFMLDNAEYFVRTFIRGPVCRGNIATDVIRDNFWTFFQSPDSDLYITNAQHRAAATPLLGVPGQKVSMGDLFPQWMKYTKLRNEYSVLRNQDYGRLQPKGAGIADIWDGDGHNDNAVLSIYRQHDSSSVRKGLWGEIPQTMWLMDYPLLERTYYSLVVNFNVFATVSHQAQTRLYFDLIRHGSESSFLRLMPASARKSLSNDWYQDSGKLKMWLYYPKLETTQPSAIAYQSKDPKTEFANLLLNRFSKINARPDPINRCPINRSHGDNCYRGSEAAYLRAADQSFSRMAARPASRMPVINFLPEASILRIFTPNGPREIYTMLRNRAHSNVAYMAAESLRYQPAKDTLTIYPGVLTSYPNFAFNIPAAEVAEFSLAMQAVNRREDFEKIVQRWGVRRTHPDFWTLFHDYTAYIHEKEPVEAALLDMNRYQNL